MKKGLLALSLSLALGAAGCAGGGSVLRIYSGKQVEGPFIGPDAYAHYAQAALLEAEGKYAAAAEEYAQAAEHDPDSPDILTRLGAVHCRMGSNGADAFFDKAEERDESYAPLWRERARCELGRGHIERAREHALAAVALDPEDEASSLLVVEAERRAGKKEVARRWLNALLVRDPSARLARDALDALDHESARAPIAAADLHSSARFGRASAKKSVRPTALDVDRALLRKPAEEVRAIALSAGIPHDALALRAAALGRFDLAKSEAARALDADPSDTDAWIAALVAADAEPDRERFDTLLGALAREPSSPSPLGARLMAELVLRRVGERAAQAWLEAVGPLPEPADELERRVEARRMRPVD